jgi:glycosyltransferase involved in cell wall biosynthesis
MRKIVLFYKKLIEPGGAERLLINEYIQFTNLGYIVDIVSFKIEDTAFFGENIEDKNKVILGDSNWLISIKNLVKYINKNTDAIYLCASGHIEIYIASLFSGINYSLHIHHPSFMSFNETDKYSLFQIKYFKEMSNSNFGANRFEKILKDMTLSRKIRINLRAILSIKAIKSSQNNFVLSKYAQKEKKTLFGVTSHVFCGALDDNIFNYHLKKDFTRYDKFKYKILTIARLDENKRLDELLNAFSEYLKIESNSILFIGGAGPELGNLKNIVKVLNIRDNVVFLGFIPTNELFDWYGMADLFVSIDWADYRLTMYEALAMDTKVLLSNETDVDEFLVSAKYLYITKPDAVNTKNSLVKSLLENKNISFNELKEYLMQFTWSNYCKKLISVLDKRND